MPVVIYHRHNSRTGGQAVLNRLLAGENCALVTDAGTSHHQDEFPAGGIFLIKRRRRAQGRLMDCYFNSCIARMHFGQTFLPWKESQKFLHFFHISS